MDAVLANPQATAAQDHALSQVFERERRHLRNFIRRRVPGDVEAEDILQDVFYELVEAYRLMKPVAHAGAWMMRVAKNRITDLFRGRRETAHLGDKEGDGGRLFLEDLLPSRDAGPDAVYARRVLLNEIDAALAELPASQREVFVAHEIDGRSFAEMAAETGVNVKTLLSRKHYAVQYLRRRLQATWNEMNL